MKSNDSRTPPSLCLAALPRAGVAIFALGLAACSGSGDQSASASAAASTKAGASSAKTSTSAAPGTSGSASAGKIGGTMGDPKKVDKAMVSCTWTKGYAKDRSFEAKELAEFEVKNLTDDDFNYVQFNLYYYDKDGKLLKTFPSSEKAQPFLKGGETKKDALGEEKTNLPPGTTAIECEVSGGSYKDDSNWKNDKLGLPDRPMGGKK